MAIRSCAARSSASAHRGAGAGRAARGLSGHRRVPFLSEAFDGLEKASLEVGSRTDVKSVADYCLMVGEGRWDFPASCSQSGPRYQAAPASRGVDAECRPGLRRIEHRHLARCTGVSSGHRYTRRSVKTSRRSPRRRQSRNSSGQIEQQSSKRQSMPRSRRSLLRCVCRGSDPARHPGGSSRADSDQQPGRSPGTRRCASRVLRRRRAATMRSMFRSLRQEIDVTAR